MEGILYNSYYADESLKKSKIICIQEHWLFSCYKYKLRDVFPELRSSSKSVDEKNRMDAWRVPRGYGGVVTLWSNDMHPWIKEHRDKGSERMVVITVEPIKLCIINIYMPSGNERMKKDEYLENLTTLRQVMKGFMGAFKLLIVGDFNIDLSKNSYRKDARRKALVKMLKDF